MYFRKVFVSAIVVALALSGCAVTSRFQEESKTTNVLSGREGLNGPLLVVKIDDTKSAHPQIGLEDADIVYIEQVEGGLTRLAAVFSSKIPKRIGPVRSARISDIELLAQLGRVAFAYSGAQRKLLPVIASANMQDLGAQRQSSSIYTTDPNRTSPYAMVLRADRLMQRVADQGYLIDSAKDIGFKFGAAPDGGVAIEKVDIHWPAAMYSAEWSKEQSRWLLFHNNTLNIADSGKVLGPTTLIIQMVSITPSEYGDKFGGVTPLSKSVGTGKAYVLRDGRYFETIWNRPTSTSGTVFSLPNGETINFAPGQIWIALTDREPDFTSPVPAKSK